MSERKFSFVPGEYYHVYNRGNSKQTIFHDIPDYRRFLKLLYVSNATNKFKLHFLDDPVADFDRGEPIVAVGAYCLMPNHFHILITPKTETGLSEFMKKLSTGYSMYFNNKYDRSGTLFEGKFKAEHVNEDGYLKYLFAYIHLNPVKLIQSDWKEVDIRDRVKAEHFCVEYKFSSFQDYLGKTRIESVILDRAPFPEYFPTGEEARQNAFVWFSNKDFKQERPIKNKQIFPV